MTLQSLPQVTVEIAFAPTDIMSSTQTWTDVTYYLRDFSTHGGRQHYLDRIEASVLSLTLDGRDGVVMGYGMKTRLPIRVTAYDVPTAHTYSVFNGVIDSVEPRAADALNIDIVISATDKLKFLSLRYLNNKTLYDTYATVSSVRSYYGEPSLRSLPDLVGTYTGSLDSNYLLTEGVALYDPRKAIDVTGGTQSSNVSNIIFPYGTSGASYTDYAIEFWVIGQGLANSTLLPLQVVPFGSVDIDIKVNVDGELILADGTNSNIIVNDGYWHHVAVISNSGVQLIVDGVVTSSTAGAGPLTSPTSKYNLGNSALGYFDKIVVSNNSVTTDDILNRYVAGSLLRNVMLSGDRIAECLLLAGFGSIAGGTILMPNYDVNDVLYEYKKSSNGCFETQGFLSPVLTTTVLSVIQSASETEVGTFLQNDDGRFVFYTRSFTYTDPRATGVQTAFSDNASSSVPYNVDSFSQLFDDVDVWTHVTVTPQNGTSQTYSTGDDALYGSVTLEKSGTLHESNDAAYQTAAYLGYLFQSPLTRINNVELRSITNNGALNAIMLGRQIGERVSLVRNLVGNVYNNDFIIESINHEYVADPGVFRTMFVLDPYPIRNTTQDGWHFLIFDDPTYGVLDGTNHFL